MVRLGCTGFGGGTGATGSITVGAARDCCNLASYPGDGVTVGGAARTGSIDASTTSAAEAADATIRFISVLPAASLSAKARVGCDTSHFKATYGRICSGVSPGAPLPAASALLISSTTRRDNGTCKPRRSAISVMTPCR